MNKFLLVFLLPFSPIAFAQITSETYCFNSGESKPVNFQMRTYFDKNTKWQGGFVKYENSKSFISIVPKNVTHEVIDPNRPWQTTTVWSEVSGNQISGEYEMMSQGANIYSMTYTNFKRNKKYSFLLDTNIVSSENCDK